MKNSDRNDTIAPGFIPHEISPDNWPYFTNCSNPLSSKGMQSMELYEDDVEEVEGMLLPKEDTED